MNNYSLNTERLKASAGEAKTIAGRMKAIAEELRTTAAHLDMQGYAAGILREKVQAAAGSVEDLKNHVESGAEVLNEIVDLYWRTDRMLANAADFQKSIELVETVSEEVRELIQRYINENDRVNERKGNGDETDAFDGDPVNMSTGNFVYQKAFLYCKGLLPLGFAIFYNSLQQEESSLGRGWNHNYELSVKEEGAKTRVRLGDGRERVFVRGKDGRFAGTGSGEKLEKTGKSYRYVNRNGLGFSFSENGTIAAIRDSHGNGINFEYDDEGRLSRASVNGDSWLSYTYNEDGYVARAEDHAGRKVTLGYSGGNLSEVTDERGYTYRYLYDGEGMLKSIENPEGAPELINAYDEKGRVVTQTLVDGAKLSYTYDDAHNRVEYVENNGNKIVYVHDECRRNTETIFSDGSIKTSYDSRGLMTSKTDKRGSTTRYYYTPEGRMSRTVNPLGETLDMTYNAEGLPGSVLVCGERVFSNEYDGEGNLILRRNALGSETGISYNKAGRPVEITQPDGSRIKLTYNERGNIVRIEDPFGGCTNYEYDALGRVTGVVNACGGRTDYRLDARGNILAVTNAEGNTKYYSYNAGGQITKVQDFDGSTVRYRYNSAGKLAEITDPDGGKTVFTYDAMRCISEITYPNGAVRKKAYDPLCRLIREELPGGGTVLYTYDANGNRTSIQGPDGVKNSIEYDELNRPVRFVGPDGLSTSLAYNHLGQVTAYTDVRGNTEETIYDAAGQRVAFKDAAGNLTRYRYNEMGLIEEIITPAGLKETYEYEKGGRMVRRTSTIGLTEHFRYDPLGRLISRIRDDGQELYYTYDALGRLLEVAGKDGSRIKRYAYDAVGRVVLISDANENIVKYEYTPSGHLKCVEDAAGTRTRYTYDVMGQLTSILTEEGDEDWNLAHDLSGQRRPHFLQLRRSTAGQVTSITDPLGAERHFEYDEAGRVIARTDEDGSTTRFFYNNLGQREAVRYSDGSEVSFAYDELRQLREIRDWLGVTEISRDPLGRVREVTDPRGNTVSYRTGSRGERTEMTYPDGRTVRYEYDDALRLTGLTAGDEEIRYSYGLNGKLSEKQYSNGFAESYRYEGGNLSSLTCSRSEELLDAWTFRYDKAGRQTGMEAQRRGWEEESGQYEYRYDVLDRLTEVLKDGESLRTYGYDRYGNRIRAAEAGMETFYEYDAADRLLRAVSGDHVTEYGYDLRGNVTGVVKDGETAETYSYGPANKLLSAVVGDIRYRYTYSGLGDRVAWEQLSDPAGERSGFDCVVDITRRNRNILQKMDESGTTDYLADYNYVGEIGGRGTLFYGHDGMGSITGSMEADGTVGERFAYDEFGCERSFAGRSVLFGFTGHVSEPGGLWNAGARQYDPSAGRFYGRDVVNGFLSGPQSLNRYTYCFNQPFMFVDPDGNWPSWKDVQNGLENLYRGAEQTMENLYNGAVDFVEQLPDAGDVVGFLDDKLHVTEGFENIFEWYGRHKNRDFEEGLQRILDGGRHIVEYEFPWGKSISDYWNDFTRSEIGEAVLDRFDFWRDSDGIYHTKNNCWQLPGGYNDTYDVIFEGATSAGSSKIRFVFDGEIYTFWSWKGDYVNLGAGAETGIYRGDGYQVQCAADTGLVMAIALYNRETGELIFDYAPNDPDCWWINGFNPDPRYQDMNKDDLLAVTEIDFRNNPALWEAFLKEYKNRKRTGNLENWCVDESSMTARFSF